MSILKIVNNCKEKSKKRCQKNQFSMIPPGCSACGGPFPDCKSYCHMFDD